MNRFSNAPPPMPNDCSESLERALPLPKRLRQLPGIAFLLLPSLRTIVFPSIQFFMDHWIRRPPRHIKFSQKFPCTYHKRSLRSGSVHDFMIRTHHCATSPERTSESLDDLIRFFPTLGVNDLYPRSLLLSLNRLSLPPTIEHHCNAVILSLPIGNQLSNQCVSRRVHGTRKTHVDRQEIVPVNDQMSGHQRHANVPFRRLSMRLRLQRDPPSLDKK